MSALLCLECLRKNNHASGMKFPDNENFSLDDDMTCDTCGHVYRGMQDYIDAQEIPKTREQVLEKRLNFWFNIADQYLELNGATVEFEPPHHGCNNPRNEIECGFPDCYGFTVKGEDKGLFPHQQEVLDELEQEERVTLNMGDMNPYPDKTTGN